MILVNDMAQTVITSILFFPRFQVVSRGLWAFQSFILSTRHSVAKKKKSVVG